VQSPGGGSRGKGPTLSLCRFFSNLLGVKTELLPADASSLQKAMDLLHSGELVAIPTETVYGLASVGLNPNAVKKVFSAKGRPSTDPLILHLPSADLKQAVQMGILSEKVPPEAFRLASAFWPGPLTMVLPRGPKVPDEVTAGLDTVALRYPAHPVAQQLLAMVGLPLAAPSANRFGRISPTDAASVMHELGGRIPLILDGGECTTGVESTVVSLVPTEPTILRPGMITFADIECVLGRAPQQKTKTLTPDQSMPAPGMLESHYAPQTPLFLTDQPISDFQPDMQFIHYHPPKSPLSSNQFVLSPQGDSATAARNLYRLLRQADARQGRAILMEPIPDSDEAPALRDRVQRASVGRATWIHGTWVLIRKNID